MAEDDLGVQVNGHVAVKRDERDQEDQDPLPVPEQEREVPCADSHPAHAVQQKAVYASHQKQPQCDHDLCKNLILQNSRQGLQIRRKFFLFVSHVLPVPSS